MNLQSLAVTGHKIGGPPLCYQQCGACLAKWDTAVEFILQHESQRELHELSIPHFMIFARRDEGVCGQMGLWVCKRGGDTGLLYDGTDVLLAIHVGKTMDCNLSSECKT